MRDGDLFLLAIAAGAAALIYELYNSGALASVTSSPNTTTMAPGTMAPGGATTMAPIGTTTTPASSPAPTTNAGFTTMAPTPAAGASPVNVSPAGVAFIKRQEGLTLTAIGDAGGQEIGYGHQLQAGEAYPFGISLGKAEQLLASDLEWVQSTLNSAVHVALTQNQYDALASLIYNIGTTRFLGSTLLAKLNAGDYAGAAAQFPRWNLSAGKVSSVLVARRAAEQGVFLA